MQLWNLGNSLNAIKDIQSVFELFPDMETTGAVEALIKATSSYSTEVLKLISSQVTLTVEQAKAIFEAKGLTGAELEAAVSTATLSSAQEKAEVSTNKLGTAWKGLASKLGLSVTQLNIATGALAALAVGSIVYKAYAQAQEELILPSSSTIIAFMCFSNFATCQPN